MLKKLLLSLLTFICLNVYSQNYIINDDFEDGVLGNPPNNWILKYNGTGTANQKIVDNPVKNGTKAFQMEGASSWSSEFYQEPASIPNLVTVEAWVNPEKILSGLTGSIGLGNFTVGSWGTRTSRLQFFNGKISTTYTGGSTYVIQDYTPGIWYHLKMEHNLSAKTYKIYINNNLVSGDNGSEVVTEFPMHPTVNSIHVMLCAGNSGTTKMTWDDIKVYETEAAVAYYPFNGNANDESGNGNNGIVNGATLTTDRFGNANSAYYFDGSSNYISITDNPNINIQTGESFSISYWCKYDAQNNATYLISKYKGSFGEPSFALGAGSGDLAYSWFEFTPGNGIENRGTINLYDTNWHNITTVFKSGESISIYVDGVLDITKPITYTGSIINTRNLTIGCGSNLAQFYKGSIDDIKIYNKALTATEIQNEANGLVAYYPFNGNANDESGNGNNGTVNGATLTTDRFGNSNSAYNFNGVDNDITCLFPGPIGTSPRTISFWAKTSEIPYSTWDNAAISYGSNTIYGQRFEIGVNSRSRGLAIDINGAALTKDFDNSDNDWHYYAAVFDGGTNKTMYDVKLYADGNLLNTITYDNGSSSILDTSSETPIHIGSLFNAYRFFNGDIDEVKFYNKALTETEIKSEFKTLIAYYPFNGNANDESGNNHNGTVNGPTLTTDRFGNANSAYHYHGNSNNDFIDIGDWENGGSMTINFWIKWEVFNNWGVPFDIGNGNNSDNIGIGNESTSNVLMFYVLDGSTKYLLYCNDTSTYPNSPLTLNDWTMITCTVDETGLMKAFKNGELIGTYTGFTPTRMVRTAQYLGSYNYPENGYFQGDLDDVSIFNKALSDADVLTLYNTETLAVSTETINTYNFYVHNNTLYFKNIQNLSEIKNISIFNLLAQNVFESDVIQKETSLNFLSQGIYILKVKFNNGGIGTKKIIIQ